MKTLFQTNSMAVMLRVLLITIAIAMVGWGCQSTHTNGYHHYHHPEVSVPDGHAEALRLFAKGVQIYAWTGTNWTLRAPEAKLFEASGKGVGRHYKGPTWENVDGSKVIGKMLVSAPAY